MAKPNGFGDTTNVYEYKPSDNIKVVYNTVKYINIRKNNILWH